MLHHMAEGCYSITVDRGNLFWWLAPCESCQEITFAGTRRSSELLPSKHSTKRRLALCVHLWERSSPDRPSQLMEKGQSHAFSPNQCEVSAPALPAHIHIVLSFHPVSACSCFAFTSLRAEGKLVPFPIWQKSNLPESQVGREVPHVAAEWVRHLLCEPDSADTYLGFKAQLCLSFFSKSLG